MKKFKRRELVSIYGVGGRPSIIGSGAITYYGPDVDLDGVEVGGPIAIAYDGDEINGITTMISRGPEIDGIRETVIYYQITSIT